MPHFNSQKSDKIELNEKEIKIVEFIEKNDSIKNKEIQDLLNLSPQGSHLYIRKLIDKGIIKPQGKGRSTIYILNKQ